MHLGERRVCLNRNDRMSTAEDGEDETEIHRIGQMKGGGDARDGARARPLAGEGTNTRGHAETVDPPGSD